MRLTAFLMHWKHPKPYGKKYRGKNRVVPEPKMKDLVHLRNQLERTEENMLILRHPYLTSAQSHRHMQDLRKPIVWPAISNHERNELFKKHFTWVDQLAHLRVRDAWE